MTSTLTDPAEAVTSEVLARVVAARRAQDEASVAVLVAAVDWADAHPGLDAEWVAVTPREPDLALNSDGVPLVDDRCLAELGAALGRSTDAARVLVGDVLEVRHRLPRLWRSVLSLRVPVFQAREVAQVTRGLSSEAVEFVDRQLVVLGRLSLVRVERLVSAAVARFDPDLAEEHRREAAEQRHVRITAGTGTEGLAFLESVLDAADALDLDAALTQRAVELGRLGCEEPLDVRRSIALGDLARTSQETLDLNQPDAEGESSPRTVPGRQVVLYAHLPADALTGMTDNSVGWLDGRSGRGDLTDRPILAEQIRQWCQTPGTSVRVTPVTDLNANLQVSGYQIGGRLREQLELRDRHCTFPHCRRLRTDADHRRPYDHSDPDRGGPSESHNISLLCRHHHRLKHSPAGDIGCCNPGCTCGPARPGAATYAISSASPTTCS